ncbi:MAG: hypothetical protein EPO21_11785 [Chloroflexota bacterium]|nr:MAG: hypothetical protein EPO21_11785 [Chloroflexota bacterium]
MATGKVIRAWQENGWAYLAVRVQEDSGPVEYIGSVPVGDLDGLTAAEQRAALIGAVKGVRARSVAPAVELGGFPANVNV